MHPSPRVKYIQVCLSLTIKKRIKSASGLAGNYQLQKFLPPIRGKILLHTVGKAMSRQKSNELQDFCKFNNVCCYFYLAMKLAVAKQ